MKIFIKNLRGDKTELELQESDSVLSIKEQLNTLQGHAPDLQKLILAGKILEDGKSASESGILEGSTLVLMVSKPKPPVKPAESSIPPPMPSNVLPPPVFPPANLPREIPESSGPEEIEGPGALLTGESLSSTILSIVDMGFDRKDVEAAMKAAFNNPDRAIEYLTSGLPPPPSAPSRPQQGNPAEEQFRQLMQEPTFMQLLGIIQQNPSALGPILTQLQQSNPDVYNLIANNREAFMGMLQEPNLPRIDPSMTAALPRPPQGSAVITLTPAEQQSVKNLMELGFSRNDAIEAFLSCDKNEEQAGSLLFENYQPAGSDPEFDLPGPDSGEQ